jgi:hypothetical protein
MKKIKASTFDKKFDADKDISEHLDFGSVRRLGVTPKRVNVDFPAWMVQRLDREAERLGITRQSLIKMWVDERLAKEKGA